MRWGTRGRKRCWNAEWRREENRKLKNEKQKTGVKRRERKTRLCEGEWKFATATI